MSIDSAHAGRDYDPVTGEIPPDGNEHGGRWQQAHGGFVDKRITFGRKVVEPGEIHVPEEGGYVEGVWRNTIHPENFNSPQAILIIKGEEYMLNLNYDLRGRFVNAGRLDANGWPQPREGEGDCKVRVVFTGTLQLDKTRTLNTFDLFFYYDQPVARRGRR